MLTIDPALKAQLSARIKRVLIIESSPRLAEHISTMLRQIGISDIQIVDSDKAAMAAIVANNPSLAICAFKTKDIDGIKLIGTLRRVKSVFRYLPCIIIKPDITPTDVVDARDAGVNELLFVPFAWQDFIRRLKSTVLRNVKWIECETYVGPDRRRHNVHDFRSDRKRRKEDQLRSLTDVDRAVLKLNVHVDSLLINRLEAAAAINAEMLVITNGLKGSQDARLLSSVSAIITELKHTPLEFTRLKPLIYNLMGRLDLCADDPDGVEKTRSAIANQNIA